MRISYNWLQTYLSVKSTPEIIAEKLTSVGLEVESVEYEGKKFDGIVVGEVLSVVKHPNAKKLSLCEVKTDSDNIRKIVCGAPNVSAGQKVAVALPGAVVPKNQHDSEGKPFTITEAVIRGEKSYGMICSSYELGIADDADGILVLDNEAVVGTPLAEYFGLTDVAMEIGVTPNRPDCLSHIGVAREVAGAISCKLELPFTSERQKQVQAIENSFKVAIENSFGCPRYVARLIKNVTVKQSPAWMQKYLTTAGVRPINNIVDATNFVMLEFGQPLHAFNYDEIEGNTIIVKNSRAGEKFITLDGKEHPLSGNEIMICDAEKAVAIGGVMGGLNSEISLNTKNVLLEAAYFQPQSIRRTAKRLGISTDSSYRFERGIDHNATNTISLRAALLIAELSGGELVEEYIDNYPSIIPLKEISLRSKRVNEILGTDLNIEKIQSLLNSVEIFSTQSGEVLNCSIPAFRPDIEQEIDIIEEAARLFGYDNIEDKISSEISFGQIDKKFNRLNSLRIWLEANGYNEIVTNSLMDETLVHYYSANFIKVKNPLSQELNVLRPTLMPTMLQAIVHNNNHGVHNLRYFEIGRTFLNASEAAASTYIDGYNERNLLGICISGKMWGNEWHRKEKNADIYDIKGAVLSLLCYLGLDNIDLIYYDAPSSLTEQTIGIEINNTYVGFLGKCKQELLQRMKIENEVYYAEFDVEVLLSLPREKKFSHFSKFPVVTRDLAFIISRDIAVKDVENEIAKNSKNLLRKIKLFDVFENKSLGDNVKSIAFSLSFNSSEKTLTDEDVESEIQSIVNGITKKFNATLRAL